MKKRSEWTQTLRVGCSKAEPRIFAAPQTPFTGAPDGQNLISWRWSRGHLYLQIQFGEDRCTQIRVTVVTNPRTNTQTDRDDYNILRRSLARSVIIMAISNPTRTGDVIRRLGRFASCPNLRDRWSDIRMEDPQEDPVAVHCFCVCSGNVLLGDLLGVSRSMERDLLSVLFIYPRFLCVCSVCIIAFFTCAP